MTDILTKLALGVHVLAGGVAMLAGLAALCVRKGGRLHRRIGDVFVIAMLVMAIFAAILGVILPGQVVNVIIAFFTLYLVVTAWLTGLHGRSRTGLPEKIALGASLLLCAPFVLLMLQAFAGVTIFPTVMHLRGPILIALCIFTAIIAVAAGGDLKVVVTGGISGLPRVARHLWRMCVALALALGSGFSNGFARMLPGPYHVPPAFFAPPFVMLAVLAYWLVRIRFSGWAGRAASLP
jgi:cytochrome bd-type quinol oxidase subunit 2